MSAFSFGQNRNNVEAVGTKDGSNDTFSIPSSESYEPTTLEVYLNGNLIQPSSIIKNGPGYTSFTISGGETLPEATDVLTVSYTQSA
jgi:hypothetical protein